VSFEIRFYILVISFEIHPIWGQKAKISDSFL